MQSNGFYFLLMST